MVRGSHAQSLVRTQSLVRSFPGMLSSLLSFQEHFDAHWGQRYFEQHQHVPVLAICLYLAGVYFGPRWMASRRPVRLVAISRVWNASLALFSICGVAACVPTLVGHLWHRGFHHSVCADCYELAGTGAPALWAVLFCFSKLAELLDTALLVLKKRPLLLLHWFHHASVIAFAWASWVYATPLALWYGSMNFSVHAVMYSYFFATSFDRRVLRAAPAITTLQLSQFAMGTVVNFYAYWAYARGSGCAVDVDILYLGAVMYLAYGFLFARMFVERYVRAPRRRRRVSDAGEREALTGTKLV